LCPPHYVTLWPWPLTLWPWTFVVGRVSRDQYMCHIWARSINPWLWYWRLTADFLSVSRGCSNLSIGVLKNAWTDLHQIFKKSYIIRPSDVCRNGLRFAVELLYFFLPDLRSAKRRSDRPSNVCRRFDHMHHCSKVSIYLPKLPANFTRGQKVRNSASIFDFETLSFRNEQDICNPKLSCYGSIILYVLPKYGEVRPTPLRAIAHIGILEPA